MQSYLECKDIIKIYPQMTKVKKATLRGVDLIAQKGEFISILGPSGSGKTTLLLIIAGLLEPSSGSVKISNQILNELSIPQRHHFYRQTIGIMLQNPQNNIIWGLNNLENIILPIVMRSGNRQNFNLHQGAMELLEIVGLTSQARKKPKEISGGEIQRLGLAVAMANNPELLLLDEPTSQLDSLNAKKILNYLKELCQTQKRTVIMVTHDLRLVKQTDRAYFLKNGVLEVVDPTSMIYPSN